MKKFRSLTSIFFALLVLLSASIAEARIGGGRSSGFRGSRGFGFSQRQTAPRPNPNYGQQPSPGFQNRPMQDPARAAGSPMMRGVLGGLAGGFIGSMLFRNMGYGAGGGTYGSGGIGLLEILLLAGLGFFLFRMFANRRRAATQTTSSAGYYDGFLAPATPLTTPTSESPESTLQRYDVGFDLNSFKEQRMDDFLRIQSAWNRRDIDPVQNIIAPEFRQVLNTDIESLKRDHRINKLENIAVRRTELVESWQEFGKEYATVRFDAQLIDYTIDENTQSVVEGDRNQPVRFDEEWTFVRDAGEGSVNSWKLTAIAHGQSRAS
jgi:predicted lipid-binding transport protein (Tim44 family)